MPNLFAFSNIGVPTVYKNGVRDAGLPVTLTEAKAQLLIPTAVTTWDTYLTGLINASMAYFEKFTRQILISRTFTGYLNDFPNDSFLIEKAPLISITSVKYYDTDNVLQTVTDTNYYITESNYYSYLMFINTYTYPSTYDRPQIVQVEFKAGLCTDDTDCPADIKQGLLQIIAYWWENRGDTSGSGRYGQGNRSVPQVAKDLFFPYKILKVITKAQPISFIGGSYR